MRFITYKHVNSKNFYLYVFIISFFLCFTIPALVSEGMVMDGTLYACIARNLAEGVGSFWQLHFSETFFNVFYEHPPLAIAIESLFFKLLGDSIYVERFYSFLTLLITTGLIILIWKEIAGNYKLGWMPLLIYFSIRKVSWAFANNMLENTMVIFICLSVLFYLKSLVKRNLLSLVFCGLALVLAFLSKGFTSLFVFTLPFFYWLFQRKISFLKMIFQSLIISVSFLVLIIIIYYSLSIESQQLFLKYINQSVFGKLDLQTVDSRFFILIAVIYHFIPATIISLVTVLSTCIIRFKTKPFFAEPKAALTFFALALSGIIPIMISFKQSGHYAITTYPFIAIAIAMAVKPYFEFWTEKLFGNLLVYRVFKVISFTSFALVFILFYLNYNKIGQDKIMIEDCRKIIEVVGERSTIGLYPVSEQQYYLYAYYNRYGHVNLDQKQITNYKYLLTSKEFINNPVLKDYIPLEIDTKQYIILKKKLD